MNKKYRFCNNNLLIFILAIFLIATFCSFSFKDYVFVKAEDAGPPTNVSYFNGYIAVGK